MYFSKPHRSRSEEILNVVAIPKDRERRKIFSLSLSPVVAMSHGDDRGKRKERLFSLISLVTRNFLGSSPWLMATTKKFCRRRDLWRRQNFFCCRHEQLSLSKAWFLAKALKKIPIEKKIDYSTFSVKCYNSLEKVKVLFGNFSKKKCKFARRFSETV